MGARSSGMFPIRAAWVDAELLLANGVAKKVTNLMHNDTVSFLGYFSEDAVGSVTVTTSNGYVVTLAADGPRNRKVIATRSGFELGDLTAGGTQDAEVTLDTSGLSAGSVQVSLF